MDAEAVIQHLGLTPLGFEGGYYKETFRQQGVVDGHGGPRSPSTAIYYLLTPDTCSLMHRLRGPEVYHFYLGDPIEMLMVDEDGPKVVLIGPDLAAGHQVQHVVPGGVWQGSRLVPGGRYALLGTTMAPGFDLEDFTLGRRDALAPLCPAHGALLAALTPTRLTTPRLELAAATRDLLHAELRGPRLLAAGLGAEVPGAWPPAGHTQAALQADLAALARDPTERAWRTYYVLDRAGRLVGAGGFTGPPDAAGAVTVRAAMVAGEEALGTEALDALARHALEDPRVRTVEPQGGDPETLARAGFQRTDGAWRRTRAP